VHITMPSFGGTGRGAYLMKVSHAVRIGAVLLLQNALFRTFVCFRTLCCFLE